jgi:hypothetical protein
MCEENVNENYVADTMKAADIDYDTRFTIKDARKSVGKFVQWGESYVLILSIVNDTYVVVNRLPWAAPEVVSIWALNFIEEN